MDRNPHILIIGSGLGGLICGYILSREGFKVTILEKHHKFGGNLQTFRRNGVEFDTGMHYVGSLDKGQVLHKFFNYFGLLGKVKYRRLDENGFDRIFIKDNEYPYAMGYDNFVETAAKYFPGKYNTLKAYGKKIRQVAQGIDPYNLREVDMSQIFNVDSLNENVFSHLRTLTSDQRLQNYFSALNILYAGERDKTSMYVHALINNHYIESAYRFVDGSGQVADAFVENIENNGGEAFKNSEVMKFIFDDKKKIKAVKTCSGELFHADFFISNMHPYNTIKLVPPGLVRKVYRKRLQRLPNTISSFAIYAVLKERAMGYLNSNYYCHKDDDVWAAGNYDKDRFPQYFGMYPLADTIDEKFTRGFSIMTYMDYDEVKPWENTVSRNRGEDYEAFKEEKAQKLLDFVETRFPGIRNKIKVYYTSTPLTLRDYTATRRGSIFGIMRDCNKPYESYIFPRTKVPNLYLTGQNLNLHGMLGVSISGLLTCGEFVGVNYIIRKINEEYDKEINAHV